MSSERHYDVATANREATSVFKQHRWTWDNFVDWLGLDDPADRKDCGNFVGGSLRGGHRTKETVESRSLVALDADQAGPGFLVDVRVSLSGVAFVAYTTWRHTSTAPRWRVVLPLSRDVSSPEYRLIVAALMRELGAEQFDSGSLEAERLMHKPSTQGEHDSVVVEGEPLDADEWLAQAKALGLDVVAERAVEPYDGPGYRDLSEDEREQADDAVLSVMAYWRNLLSEATEWDEKQRDDKDRGWEALARDAAWAFAVLVNAPWSGLTEERARVLYDTIMPEVIAADPMCAGKWRADTVAKAASEGVSKRPPWALIPERRSDGVEWFLSAIMPTRGYGLLGGPIGSGKSSVVGLVVTTLTQRGYRVRYCVEDEPQASARRRLELAHADLGLVQFDEVPDLSTKERIEHYARGCAEQGVDLVVFDLLVTANPGYEENRPEKVKAWTALLVAGFCNDYGIGILGTHHWNNNAKAGSEMQRLSGAGAIAAKTEFFWSVAISRDKSEQVWSSHPRRRASKEFNFEMHGQRHVVERIAHPFTDELVEMDVYTVEYGDNTERTAHQVANDAAREFQGGGSQAKTEPGAIRRFLAEPRQRSEVDEFLFWTEGSRYSHPTVAKRLREAGAVLIDAEGNLSEKGKRWVFFQPDREAD